MRKLLILALLVAPLALAAVDKTVTWTPPTARVNGDVLTASEIAGYDLECLTTGGELVYTTGLPADPQTFQTPEVFADGDFICRMRTIDTDGLLSTWNDSNVFTVGRCDATDCRPLPPSSITVIVP